MSEIKKTSQEELEPGREFDDKEERRNMPHKEDTELRKLGKIRKIVRNIEKSKKFEEDEAREEDVKKMYLSVK